MPDKKPNHLYIISYLLNCLAVSKFRMHNRKIMDVLYYDTAFKAVRSTLW